MTMIPLVQIHGVDDLRPDSATLPLCGSDDVVVQVRECGICGSLSMQTHELHLQIEFVLSGSCQE